MRIHKIEINRNWSLLRLVTTVLIGSYILLAMLACERDIDSEFVDDDVKDQDDSFDLEEHEEASDYIWDDAGIISITMSGTSISSDGEGVLINGSEVTITAAGNYSFSGSLSDGQINVNTEDEEVVRIILNSVNLNNSSSAPLYIVNASKTIIVLPENTDNFVSDASSYPSGDNRPNAAIFSSDDLSIFGKGTLTVDGNYNDGIASTDGLIIKSGTITVNAVDDGIRGKDYLVVKDGDITIEALGDGLKSDNDEISDLGYITIETGKIHISSSGDAITAETEVIVYDCDLNLTSGGGSTGSSYSVTSAKGIKSGNSIEINSGSVYVDAADDAIHSNGDITINGGFYSLASGDDAIHADLDLVVNWGEIDITEAYEGIESAAGNITINDGLIYLQTRDDGINLAAGGSSQGGRQKSMESTTASYMFQINGGTIVLDAGGDGLDSNDDFKMTGGITIVSGSSSSSNSALDVVGSLTVDGGFLVAAGSSRMAEAPGSASDQNSILITFKSTQGARTLVHIEDQYGEDILNFEPPKSFDSMAFSSSELISGNSYTIYLGGSHSGTAVDGIYEDGTYTSGTLYTNFTVSGTVSYIN